MAKDQTLKQSWKHGSGTSTRHLSLYEPIRQQIKVACQINQTPEKQNVQQDLNEHSDRDITRSNGNTTRFS